MKTKLNKKGFTIIEVLIVLAIAGLILLIVFLAVPALQRNSRNTQRKNDVAGLLGAFSEYTNNNNGTFPTAVTSPSAGVVRFGCGFAVCTTSEAKVGYYNKGIGTGVGQVSLQSVYAATGPFNTAADDRVVIVGAADCAAGATTAGASRSVSAVYEIENGANRYGPTCDAS